MPDATPRPTLGDHARVAWLLLATLAGLFPWLVFLPLSPLLTPWLKRRARRRLRGRPAAPADAPTFDVAACADATVFVVAGEDSGDELAARVVRHAKEVCPTLRVRGYAGPACAEAGAELDRDITSHAVLGVVGVIWSLGTWWKLCAETLARFREEPPDVLLTVDFPGLNVRLARWARARGIHTVHLVAPQIWAHTPWRIFRWRKAVDVILATFPYEPLLFETSGIRTAFVGHPLFEAPLPEPRGADVYPADGPVVVELWPGSRKREIVRHAAVLSEAAAEVQGRWPEARFVLRLAKARHEALFAQHARAARWQPRRISATTEAIPYDAPLLGAIAASGTATAQLAVDLVPVSIYYRLPLIEWVLGQFFITAPWIALANLVLGRSALRERLCWAPNAGEGIARDFLATVGDEARWRETRAALAEVRARLETPHVATRAAGWLLAETAAQRKGAVAAPGAPRSPAGGPS